MKQKSLKPNKQSASLGRRPPQSSTNFSMLGGFKTKLICVLAIFIFYGCNNDDDSNPVDTFSEPAAFNSEVVVNWFDLIKVLTTETPGYTPPVAARAFGYTGVALYESVQVGIADKASLSGKLNELNLETNYDETLEYHWPTVANATIAQMTKTFYSNASDANFASILALEASYNTQFLNDSNEAVIARSIAFGTDVANKILLWSNSDGGFEAQFNNFPSDYTPLVGDQYWQPTAPGFSPALQPYWGSNRPFIALNVENVIPENPPAYSTDENSVFYQRALAVYETVNNVTPEQTVIAEFWSDDPQTSATPPGHSISVLNQLINENDINLADASEAFAKLSVGINDAFISCWLVKYTTNYPRPITYINQQIDPTWSSILITPPFPEYTSGHSVQSGVLAQVLTSIFGENFSFTDKTHENRTDIDGTPRSFNNFYEMAEEAALSRLYGGIHFQEAIDLGLVQGYLIGDNVIAAFE